MGRQELRATETRCAQCIQRNSCTTIAIDISMPMCITYKNTYVQKIFLMFLSTSWHFLCSWHLVAVSMDQRFAAGWTFGQVVPAIQGLCTLFFWFARRISSGPGPMMFFATPCWSFYFTRSQPLKDIAALGVVRKAFHDAIRKVGGRWFFEMSIDDFLIWSIQSVWRVIFSSVLFATLSFFGDRFLKFFPGSQGRFQKLV